MNPQFSSGESRIHVFYLKNTFLNTFTVVIFGTKYSSFHYEYLYFTMNIYLTIISSVNIQPPNSLPAFA